MRGIVTGEEPSVKAHGRRAERAPGRLLGPHSRPAQRSILGSRAGVLAAALLMLASCVGPTRRSTPVRDPGVNARSQQVPASAGPAPTWSMLPTSWSKLTEIERWISDRPSRRDYWSVEAQLQLAEGRLAYANDLRDPSTPPSYVALRRREALAGFERVLSDPTATSDQRSRARSGAQTVGLEPTGGGPVAVANVGGLIRRPSWRARPASRARLSRATSPWRWITVHHSVVRTEDTSPAASFDTVRGIQRDHMDSKGWGDIGYHFLIDPAGRVIEGRELIWQGAHAGGQNNIGNVGICLLGNFDEDQPSRASIASLDRLVLELQGKLGIPRLNVRPHRAWKETACPGRHLMPWFTRG